MTSFGVSDLFAFKVLEHRWKQLYEILLSDRSLFHFVGTLSTEEILDLIFNQDQNVIPQTTFVRGVITVSQCEQVFFCGLLVAKGTNSLIRFDSSETKHQLVDPLLLL